MASIVNLTLPIAPDIPVGQVWPHDVPFQMEPIRSYASGGAQLEYYQFHTDTGTRIVTSARFDPGARGIGALDFARLVDVRTAVVDIPVARGQVIEAEQIEALVGQASGYGHGDALLLRTGWGSAQRARALKERFVLDAPRLSRGAAHALASLLRERASPFLAIDTPCLVDNALTHAQREWLGLPAWLRPPWPSDIARTYLRHYGPDKHEEDWGGDRIVLQACPVLLALANTQAATQPHSLLTALPFFVEDAPASPATVVAKAVPAIPA